MLNSIPPSKWRLILRQNFTRWEPLADFLELTPAQRQIILTKTRFPLNLPLRLAQKIVKGTLNDPILKQFLPTIEEERKVVGFGCDPIGDNNFRTTSKLLHKYEGRVLLVTTGACAMHCRYCFRQNFDYDVENSEFRMEIDEIRNDVSIQEVILSGGDPLSLSDRVLKNLLDALCAIPHVRRIRFHTRFPIGIPERLDDDFLHMIQNLPCQVWFVIHSNHPKELDEDVLARLKALQKTGAVLMNQAVLLQGVNNDAVTLKELCERLVNNGIVPYYLHQLDRVQGAAHFEVLEEEGKALISTLANELSGYAVPRYVRETAGQPGKTLLYP